MENQLTILSESLDKKLQVLAEIREYNDRQEKTFTGQQVDLVDFDEAAEEKGRLIEKLTRLDDGFELLYKRIAEQLAGNKEQYAVQIRELQEKIKQVTDMSVSIQAQESRNKKLVEEYFRNARAGLGQNRKSSKVAYDYYKSMSGAGLGSSRFMDDKK